jgi:fused signal recognition particle receptor
MLRFFKKKPPAPVPEPAQAPPAADPAGQAVPVPAPSTDAPPPSPGATQAPPRWPQGHAEPIDLQDASAGVPQQSPAFPAPASRAEAPLQPTAPAEAKAAPQATAPAEAPAQPTAPVKAEAAPQPTAPAGADAAPQSTATVQAEAVPRPATPVQARAPSPAEPAAAKTSWLQRLKQGLSRTGQSIGGLFVGVKVDENLFEELETALIMADAGMEATQKLLTALRARVKKDRLEEATQVREALRQILADHLRPLERRFDLARAKPLVVMIAGVNGAGKTTSIGKLANTFQAQGASVLLAAGDTFRAAAREQLMEWGARNNVTVIAQEGGDPAAVAFDAVNAARARGAGVVMVDTAGRLPTQLHLMEELKKIRRVIGKADSAAPHEVLLVVDGNTGQNALAQIRAFDAAINLTGLVVTKLDGTAKGGTLAAVAAGSQGVRPVPVYWIGVGERLEDLQPFVADEFAAALLGMSA